MSNIIDSKKEVTIDEATNSESLKKLSDKEIERMIQTLLTTENDNDVTVNILIAELLKRGVSKEEIKGAAKDDTAKEDKIKKAFESLGL
jgi:hypothetical protein